MRDFLNQFHKVDDLVLTEYLQEWSEIKVPKRTVISKSDNTERYLYFVLDGIQKSYFLNEDKEHVMFFAYAPSFSGIVESFLTQTPSKYFLETITDSRLMRISYEKHIALLEIHRELETLFRKVTEQFLVGVIERHHELMAHNAETRFKIFMNRSAHLVNIVPQKDLASYLRIDSTNFSKLINNVKI